VEKKSQNDFLKYSNLGLQLLLVVGLCAWAGLKLDQYLQLKFPVFLLLFMLGSFASMMYKLYRSSNE